jgi:tRNA threonylcarbamoyladenosine biosynthesis protein TsaB
MVASAIADAGLRPSELTAIAVSAGPGTFTGVRVGLAAARAMSLTLGLPAEGFSSLHVLAMGAIRAGEAGPSETVAVAVDARRGEVYAQQFGPGGVPAGPPELLTAAAAAAAVPAGAVLVGSGVERLAEVHAEAAARVAVRVHPAAADLAALAAARFVSPDWKASGPPRPIYLRRPDARLRSTHTPGTP